MEIGYCIRSNLNNIFDNYHNVAELQGVTLSWWDKIIQINSNTQNELKYTQG